MKIGICSFEISDIESTSIQIFPSGTFRTVDARPNDVAAWEIDGEVASKIIDSKAKAKTDMVVDYDHQSLYTKINGQKAVAAGWIKNLEWRDGVGLFAASVDWTPKAKEHIQNKEYKYISPVFTYDHKTGKINSLINCALTNTPAIDGMEQVLASLEIGETKLTDENITQIATALKIDTNATVDAIVAASEQIISENSTLKQIAKESQERVVALSLELEAKKKVLLEAEVDKIVSEAIDQGKVIPASADKVKELAYQNLDWVKEILACTVATPLTTDRQSSHAKQQNQAVLTDLDREACRKMGISEEFFIKTKEQTLKEINTNV